MEVCVLIVFLIVYLGMALGNLPGLALDRTGIALLGAIAMIAIKRLSLMDAISDVDVSTIAILFSFMIISAQLYYSGFYTYVTERVGRWEIAPQKFLLVIILLAGILSAALINDIVCLAMTPLLIRTCHYKKFNPLPFLIGLMCGSNIGSALTLIGNPQNILIGQMLDVPFAWYTLHALVPVVLGWLVCWGIILWQTDDWKSENHDVDYKGPSYDSWQSLKGLIAISLLLIIFLFSNLSRAHASLIVAGCLLLSRHMASKRMLGFIDWQLLVLFIGLFIVSQEFNTTSYMHTFISFLQAHHIDLSAPAPLFLVTTFLSNLISNVPAVMLLLPFASSTYDASILALTSTLAGNMFIVGSIANIIVATQAAPFGINITWRKHIVYGLPITIVTLVITAGWLYMIRGQN